MSSQHENIIAMRKVILAQRQHIRCLLARIRRLRAAKAGEPSEPAR